MRRLARRPPNMSNQNVDLFEFRFEDKLAYFVLLTASGKSNESAIGNIKEIASCVRGQCNIWGLSKFKDQRIKPEQMREAVKYIWIAERV